MEIPFLKGLFHNGNLHSERRSLYLNGKYCQFQDVCTRFVLPCVWLSFDAGQFYPYPSGFGYCHWGNEWHDPLVSLKQPWRLYRSHECSESNNPNIIMHSKLLWISMEILYMYCYNYCHDDVIIWKRFLHYWPFVRGVTGHLGFSSQRPTMRHFDFFTLVQANCWINTRAPDDLRHYDLMWHH